MWVVVEVMGALRSLPKRLRRLKKTTKDESPGNGNF